MNRGRPQRCTTNFARGSIINIDAQDAQDNQHVTLLHEKPAPAMIVCRFADTQDYKPAVA